MGWTTWVQFLAGTMMGFLSLCHLIHTISEVHLASNLMGTRGSYPSGKVAWAWS